LLYIALNVIEHLSQMFLCVCQTMLDRDLSQDKFVGAGIEWRELNVL